MTLKAFVTKLEELDEPLRPLYTPTDGGFVLDADVEAHPQVKGLKSSFEKEKADRKTKGERLALFEGIDPDVARKLIEEHNKNQEKKLIDAGEVDKLFEQRTGKMKLEHEKTVQELKDKLNSNQTHLEKLLIESVVSSAARSMGVRDTALDDVHNRARMTFRVEDGKAVAYDPEKQEPIYGPGAKPLTVDDWMKELAGKAPHLFNDPKGGGTTPGAGSANGSGGSAAYTLNRVDAKDPAKYRAAKAEANKAGLALPVIRD